MNSNFSLPELRRAMQEKHGHAPSMPTLKAWSAKGDFRQLRDLEQAMQLVEQRMNARASLYSAAGQRGKKAVAAAKEKEPPAGDVLSLKDEQLIAQIADVVAEQFRGQLQGLVHDIGEALQQVMAHADRQAKAIEQLDAVRRHLMQQHDRKQQPVTASASQTMDARGGSGGDFLEMQRLARRLSVLEGTVARLSA